MSDIAHVMTTQTANGHGASAVRKNDVLVVLVKMSVEIPLTAGMRDYATRREVVDDIANLCKIGAQSHLTITGHVAKVS